MPKFKRELVPGTYLTPADMLQMLSQQQLSAAAVQGTIMLAAEPAITWLLDHCCIGTVMPVLAGGSFQSSSLSQTMQLAGVNRSSDALQDQHQQYQLRLQNTRPCRGGQAAVQQPSLFPMPPAAVAAARAAAAAERQAGCNWSLNTAAPNNPADTSAYQSPQPHPRAAEHRAGCHLVGRSIAIPAVNTIAAARAAGTTMRHSTSTQKVDVDTERTQLVQLSCQQACFLVSVLQCCKVYAPYIGIAQQLQRPQQQQPGTHQCPSVQHQSSGPCQQQPQVHQQQQQQGQGQQQQQGRPMSCSELWYWCCLHHPGGAMSFVSKYAAYHHFRAKGWLPYSGLMYGADYVLYQLHPECVHSDFLVMVLVHRTDGAGQPVPISTAAATAITGTIEGVDACNLTSIRQNGVVPYAQLLSACLDVVHTAGDGRIADAADSGGSTELAWLDAHILQRLARQVLKRLLLLYVTVPLGLELGSPECMQQLQVREVLVQRWVAAAFRGAGDAYGND